jgi:hypothetical protein
MSDRQCLYCGRSWKEESGCCAYCGAPAKLNGKTKYDPFFCNGYIVYEMRDYSRRALQFVFYKGVTYMGNVWITEREMESMSPVMDIMPLVMERLEKA